MRSWHASWDTRTYAATSLTVSSTLVCTSGNLMYICGSHADVAPGVDSLLFQLYYCTDESVEDGTAHLSWFVLHIQSVNRRLDTEGTTPHSKLTFSLHAHPHTHPHPHPHAHTHTPTPTSLPTIAREAQSFSAASRFCSASTIIAIALS